MFKGKLTSRETQVRFARFLVVGAAAYGVQLGTMQAGWRVLGTNFAFALAFVAGLATHYVLNRFWALPSARVDTLRQFKEYLGVAAISFVLNFALFHLCADVFGLGKVWSLAVAVPPSTAVVFLLLNTRVFRAGSV